ncbi:MAG: glutathione S-transferase family protein, partial [Pseudomonadota bacterium]
VVWGIGTPRTMRVHWALHELEVNYETRPIKTRTADMDALEFLAISPGKKIPAFEYGSVKMVESGAIVFYLYSSYAAIGKSIEEFAQISRWSSFALTELDATALYVLRRHRDLPAIYGDAPGAVQAAKEYFARQIDVVNTELSDGRRYIVGDDFSPADIMLVTCCDWAVAYELPLPTIVSKYHQSLAEMDSYLAARQANFP